ncbi:MAG: hypothetical protein M0T78_06445 [Actinomycetota bacterium]|nr:hypothetical protein [Actinomycetota bacterium]
MGKLREIVKDNSLSITLFALFAICISAQSFPGWKVQNETLALHHREPLGYWNYLTTGTFWEGLASNWQAAVLQLGSLIVFSSFLYQRGAPHSLDPLKAKNRKGGRKGGRHFNWIQRHSLSLVFLALFLFSFTLHLFSGASAYNTTRALVGQSPISTMNFLFSANFWSVTLDTWQAEYLAIALYIVLTIFLHQEHSPESKPNEAREETTGEANE